MMKIRPETERALRDKYGDHITSVDELDCKILVILDYKPREDSRELSIAFDCKLRKRCWLSEKTIQPVAGIDGPRRHKRYKDFQVMGKQFYGFSIDGVDQSHFDSLGEIESMCDILHNHIKWQEQ